ncbi:peptide deformylase [Allostreptomyces psammosilenae]|uniref:Peptide deformylase n=1 Tax=Allostreptomyces psammosilenae TaxID=1892865 RepID=A0A852ZZM3_9ACTN|nr:peptide deformylase [Allostreptomyces psammosilenae]NYI03578.1 peptide deformylase [Allostreptomyces psammosilenae]
MSTSTARPTPTERPVRVQGQPVESFPRLAPEAGRGTPRRITVVGEEVLHQPCREVTDAEFGSAELHRLIDDMFVTMYVAEGCGLAANQVGVDLRLFVYDCLDEDGVRHVGHVCNPVVDPLPAGARRLIEDNEGCLSVPGPHTGLARPDTAVVRGRDRDGRPVVIEGKGYFARCLQHETDHLHGQLYVDRLGKRERRAMLRAMEEQREQVFARRAAKAAELGVPFADGPA